MAMTAPMYCAVALNTNNASGEAVLKKRPTEVSGPCGASAEFSRKVQGRCDKSLATTAETGTNQPTNDQSAHGCIERIHA